MKFTVYLALLGMASCQQLPETPSAEEEEDWEDLEDDDLEEMLDFTFNENDGRFIGDISERQRDAWRNLQDGFRDKFGKKFQDMGKRYGPLWREFSNSKAYKARQNWMWKQGNSGPKAKANGAVRYEREYGRCRNPKNNSQENWKGRGNLSESQCKARCMKEANCYSAEKHQNSGCYLFYAPNNVGDKRQKTISCWHKVGGKYGGGGAVAAKKAGKREYVGPKVAKFFGDKENFIKDVVGGRDRRGYWKRSVLERASNYERLESKGRKRMSRVHVDNNTIKDVVEDFVDLLKDNDALARDKELHDIVMKLGREVVKEKSLWKMVKMAQNDSGIHNWDEFGKKAKEFGMKMRWAKKNCPLMRRMRKVNERMFRAMVARFKVTDLPKDARLRWVNWMERTLVKKLQRDPKADVLKTWKRMCRHTVRHIIKGTVRWWKSLPAYKDEEFKLFGK